MFFWCTGLAPFFVVLPLFFGFTVFLIAFYYSKCLGSVCLACFRMVCFSFVAFLRGLLGTI